MAESDSKGIGILMFITAIVIVKILERVTNIAAHDDLEFFTFLALFFLSPLIWLLLCIIFYALYCAVLWIIFIPSYLCYGYGHFWQEYTVSFHRFRWRSIRGFPDSETPLLSEAGCSHDCQTTSKLCQECFQIVDRSRLLSGSFYIFTRRTEWYEWDIPLRGSEFTVSKRSCQLCNILWYSLDEQTRRRLATITPRSDLPDAYPCLWVSIWKEENGRYYISLFDNYASQPENRHNICKSLEIKEEYLNGQSPSVHIPRWTGDCIELAKSWITGCQVGHKSHCSKDVLEEYGPYLPTRLLYVGDNTSHQLHLEETCSPNFAFPDIEYFALSYCQTSNGLLASQKLTLDKKDKWKSQINQNELPLTFQHAIHLTRKLELKYLWVDALCVIQDSREDQRLESSNVGKVFANAYCTIATSANANGGCFSNRTSSLLEFPCYLRFSKNTALTIRSQRDTYSPDSFAKEVDHKNLSSQSWGFQERLLSRRILHFGSKFVFLECNTHIASEAMTAGQPFQERQWIWERRKRKNYQLQSNAFHTVFNPVTGYRNSFNELRANRSKALTVHEELYLHKRWFELVFWFTRCKMMNISDHSMAILGLAQAIQDGEQDLEYMHGLWRRHFLFDLLWFVESGQTKKSSEHRTRSWSWQSVEGEVGISHETWVVGKKRSWMKIAGLITPDVEYFTDSTSAQEEEGCLTLKCPIFCCTNVFPSLNQTYILQLRTPEGGVEATFVPDVLDFEHENLVGAEIVRDVIFRPERKEGRKGRVTREVEAIRSHGIVLKRNYVNRGEGVEVTYERVGRFWMQWPLVRDEGDPRAGNIARVILGRRSGVVVRIE